jgi:hypothetical protein
MKKTLSTIHILLALAFSAYAQGDNTQTLSQLRNDYKQVGIVAHVLIKSIKLAAQDIHPLYVAQSEIIEPLKGRIKRGQQLEFYLRTEEGFDANRFLGERIVFLEGKYPIPTGGTRWYELENSSLPSSKKNIAKMRKIQNARKRD